MIDLLNGLNDRQKEAVTTTEGPLLVLAGAGSGKTKVLTHRVAYIIENNLARPWQILAITFTNKAAKEMCDRIENIVGEESNDIWIKTFHSACLRILRKDIEKIGYTTNFNIYDTNDQKKLIKDCLKDLNLNEDNYPVKSIMSKISNAKDEMISCEEFAKRNDDFRGEKYARIYTLYQKICRTAKLIFYNKYTVGKKWKRFFKIFNLIASSMSLPIYEILSATFTTHPSQVYGMYSFGLL